MVTLLAVIFVFGLLIVGHEFGHFVAAKLSGIKVMEFSFGMGPRLIKIGKGETEYSVRAFPMGGFVKMMGEDEEVDDPRSFSSKRAPIKMLVIGAGPLMNIVISIIIFGIIAIAVGYTKPVVKEYYRGSSGAVEYPAEKAGIEPGDRIVSVNGSRIFTYDDFRMIMYNNGGRTLTLQVKRGEQLKSFSLTPQSDPESGGYLIGIVPSSGKASLPEGIGYGTMSTLSFAKEIFGFLKILFAGKASSGDVSGPVGIIKYTGEAAKQGFGSLLFFTGYLSINLAIMNLLPFPALDGGWLLILLIEGISRRKMDSNRIGIWNTVGFAILILFTILITFKDIMKLNTSGW